MKKPRGRPKKNSGQQLAGSKEQKGMPPLPQEERPRTWATVITNLALVVAILTIIFAMHKGMQRQQLVTSNQLPVASEQPAPREIEGSSVISDQVASEEPFDTAQGRQPVNNEQLPVTSNQLPVASGQPAPREIEGSSVISDQVASEGQDSMAVVEVPAEPVKKAPAKMRTARLEDISNPWNSGGATDLDSEAARQVYQQQGLSPSKK